MDFNNIFMSFDESASDSVKDYKESLQEFAKDIIENGFNIYEYYTKHIEKYFKIKLMEWKLR